MAKFTIKQVRPSRPQFPPGNVPKKPPLKPPPLRPPQRTPGPRRPAAPVNVPRKGIAPATDQRSPPKYVRLLRNAAKVIRKATPAGGALAGLFADTNPGDGTFTDRELAELTDNKPKAGGLFEWPAESVEVHRLDEKGFELVLKPTERPFLAPPLVPAPWGQPDVVPEWSPEIPVPPAPRPAARPTPRPGGSPVRDPGQRPAVAPAGRPLRTHVELGISIGPVPLGNGKVGTRVRVRAKPKYHWYARTRRRYDAKGIYLRYQAFVTATFGTLTEVQDFVDAVAWNVVDDLGRPAMLLERNAAFQGRRLAKGDTLGAAAVNMRQYTAVFNGLASGKYSLDLGGAAADYTANQIGDWEAAYTNRVAERGLRRAGFQHTMGMQGLRGMMEYNGWSIHGLPSFSGSEWSRAQRLALKGRVLWHRSRGVYSARS